MSEAEVIALAVLGLAICLTNWRAGVFVCLISGFLLDPIRKIVPGEPVYLTAVVGVFLLATAIRATLRGVRFSLRPVHQWNKSLRLPMRLFFALVILESGITFVKTGSAVLATIGLIAYLAPLPAVILGYNFARTEQDALKFLKVYAAFTVLLLSGIYLSLAGYDWKILSSVGEGLIAFSPTGEQLTLLSGFFRAPEVAAWHAATATCALVLLFMVIKGQRAIQWIAASIVPFLLVALVFTGRRKFIVEIAMFGCLYLFLLSVFHTSAVKSALILVASIVLTFGAYTYLIPPDATGRVLPYYGRAAIVNEEGSGRLFGMTVDSFTYVIAQNGLLGAGAGLGSQGAQHFGGGAVVVGDAAEGGLGKVLAELGILGLVLLSWIGIALLRYSWSIVAFTRKKDVSASKLSFGLMSLMAANGIVFATAHQVFGDPFVLIILGFMIGFLFAVPKMSERALALRQREQVLSGAPSVQYTVR
jgi:hypothetical protein